MSPRSISASIQIPNKGTSRANPMLCCLVRCGMVLLIGCVELGESEKHPPLFLIGAMKCGTTGLHDELIKHPLFHKGLKPPGGMKWMAKELHFFDSDNCSDPVQALTRYKEKLPSVPSGHVVLDGTPAYFHLAQFVPWRIRRVYRADDANRNLKFVLMLRDPVDRAISHWNFVQLKVSSHDCSDHVAGAKQLDNPKDHSHLGCWGQKMSESKSLTNLITTVTSTYERCIQLCLTAEIEAANASVQPTTTLGNTRNVNGVNPNKTRQTAACLERCSTVHGTSPSGIIMRGMYGTTMKQWLRYFKPHQFCVVSYNRFASQNLSKVRTLLNIVGKFTFGKSAWKDYEWPQPEQKNPSNVARNTTDDHSWNLANTAKKTDTEMQALVTATERQVKSKDDQEKARWLLAKFYDQGGRSGLYHELDNSEGGYLGCGVKTESPLPSVYDADADLFYGP
jgi:hypothetical protein